MCIILSSFGIRIYTCFTKTFFSHKDVFSVASQRERKGERTGEKKGERKGDRKEERGTLSGCLLFAPRLGLKPASALTLTSTFQLQDNVPNRATMARAIEIFLNSFI